MSFRQETTAARIRIELDGKRQEYALVQQIYRASVKEKEKMGYISDEHELSKRIEREYWNMRFIEVGVKAMERDLKKQCDLEKLLNSSVSARCQNIYLPKIINYWNNSHVLETIVPLILIFIKNVLFYAGAIILLFYGLLCRTTQALGDNSRRLNRKMSAWYSIFLHYGSTIEVNIGAKYMNGGRDIQNVYSRGGELFNTSASDLARRLEAHADTARSAEETSPYYKQLSSFIRNGELHIDKSVGNRVRHIFDSSADFQFTRFRSDALASVSTKEDAIVKNYIPLTDIFDPMKEEAKLASRDEKRKKMFQPKSVMIQACALNSVVNVPHSNNGVLFVHTLWMIDKRHLRKAILGGHIHMAHVTETAGSVFFPMFRLNTRDEHLARCLAVTTIGSGFSLKPGSIVGTTVPLIAGEVSGNPMRQHLKKGMMEHIAQEENSFHTDRCLPIYPHKPSTSAVKSIEFPWDVRVKNLTYSSSSSSSNQAVWDFSQGDSKRVLFKIPSDVPGVSRVQDSVLNDSLEGDIQERLNGDFETLVDTVSTVSGGSDRKEEKTVLREFDQDLTIYTERFTISKTAERGKILKVFKMFDSLLEVNHPTPGFVEVVFNPVIIPFIEMRVTVSISKMFSLPMILFWENEIFTKPDATVNVKRLLSLPSTTFNLHSAAEFKSLIVVPIGHTGCFSPLAIKEDSIGQFGISTLGHNLGSTGTIDVKAEFLLKKGTRVVSCQQLFDITLVQQRLHTFRYTEKFHFDKLYSPFVLALLTFSSTSKSGASYEISVLPGHGYSELGRKSMLYPAVAGIFRMWNFWNGSVEVELVANARIHVAGSCTLYCVPSNFPRKFYKDTFLSRFEQITVDFSDKPRATMIFHSNSWLGKNLTKGEDDYAFTDDMSAECKLLLILRQAPIVSVGDSNSEVHVMVRVLGFQNLTLSEKTSRSKQAASHLSSKVATNAFPTDLIIPNGAEKKKGDSVQADTGNAVVYKSLKKITKSFVRLFFVTPSLGDDFTHNTLSFPVTFSLVKSMFKSDQVVMSAGTDKLEQGKVYIDSLNIYSDMMQAWTHYSCDVEFLFVPYYEATWGQIVASHKLDVLDDATYGLETSTLESHIGGAARSSRSCRGEAFSLFVPRREHMMRVGVRKKQVQRFLDVNGTIYVQFPADVDFMGLAVFSRPLGNISLGGESWSNRDTTSSTGNLYRETCLFYDDI
ncbi:polyprotein [Dioscorea mosaic associated virus]|uniref:Polyprotein n=5 Tax=Secoviridae TaxID=675072 RepID=A0A1D6ZNJ1_9SECO|nr:polyprotein [Dioscorea mosaic associated virus]ANV28174.1 polyprotein [Dioscorea mosaic associated virus]